MARRSPLIAAATLAALLWCPGTAAAQTRIAVYAPWSGPATADDRYALGLDIERAVADAGAGTASVSSFAKLADLRRALATGRFELALVDAGAVGALGKRARVLASWSSGRSWIIASASPRKDLRGARLALQAGDAASSRRTVERLLRDQVPARYWKAVVGAPVTVDARELVLRGKADVVLVPADQAAGLVEIADLGRWSEMALVSLGGPPDAVPAPVQAAVRARLGGSWSPGGPAFPAPARITRMLLAPLSVPRVSLLPLAPHANRPAATVDIGALWIDPHAPQP